MSKVPAHLVEEAVRFCHSVELVFVLLQQIHVALLWDKLQQLTGAGKHFYSTYVIHLFYTGKINKAESLLTCYCISSFLLDAKQDTFFLVVNCTDI